jgi:hypothetical protein
LIPIRFDREGIDWILNYAQTLKEGMWPDPESSGYTEIPGGKRANHRGPFENPCLAIAELEIRIKRCGMDGFLVEEVINGKDEERIARERHLDIDYIQRRINKVLWYCASGSKPGWLPTRWRYGMTYEEWKNNGCRFRKKHP